MFNFSKQLTQQDRIGALGAARRYMWLAAKEIELSSDGIDIEMLMCVENLKLLSKVFQATRDLERVIYDVKK